MRQSSKSGWAWEKKRKNGIKKKKTRKSGWAYQRHLDDLEAQFVKQEIREFGKCPSWTNVIPSDFPALVSHPWFSVCKCFLLYLFSSLYFSVQFIPSLPPFAARCHCLLFTSNSWWKPYSASTLSLFYLQNGFIVMIKFYSIALLSFKDEFIVKTLMFPNCLSSLKRKKNLHRVCEWLRLFFGLQFAFSHSLITSSLLDT